MDLSFLPINVVSAINKLDFNKLYELRLRCGFPVVVNYDFKRFYLSDYGVSLVKNSAILISNENICEIIDNLTEKSIYAYNDRIKQGYLTSKDGIRVGIAGECVFDKENIVTIKNFSSINIRIPHDVLGCSNYIYRYVYNDRKVNNTLVISPPGFGKTTILKDLAMKISDENLFNVLIIDERGEFINVKRENIDVISYSDKLYSFSYGIRSMAPDLIITDELYGEKDWECVLNASNSGIKIISSCHGKNLLDVLNKKYFIKGVFDRYVILNDDGNAGVVKNVYDGEFHLL